MIIYLAVVAPERDGTTILGAFSTLESAKAVFPEKGEWVRCRRVRTRWQRNENSIGYNDNEIYELTIDVNPLTS